ncbi:hypothetical protein AA313_de0210460 [Arthrobotrys entomopaga]|nr:hypothetical protein AA313_de0210460 [Arthrobotrys entomopaga]
MPNKAPKLGSRSAAKVDRSNKTVSFGVDDEQSPIWLPAEIPCPCLKYSNHCSLPAGVWFQGSSSPYIMSRASLRISSSLKSLPFARVVAMNSLSCTVNSSNRVGRALAPAVKSRPGGW